MHSIKEALLTARSILENSTPLCSDCGQLCGAACCASDSDGQGGVYLFPEEESFYTDIPWAKVEACDLEGAPAYLFTCNGHCDRNNRPLGCRIFPLTPMRRKDGRWDVRMDWRAWAMCPLMPSGKNGLSPDFVENVRNAISHIAATSDGEEFLNRWYALEKRFRTAEL